MLNDVFAQVSHHSCSVSAMNKWVSGIAYNCGCRPSVAAKWEENESGGLRMKTGSRSGSQGSELIAREMEYGCAAAAFHFSLVTELLREVAHFRRELAAVIAPAQRAFKAVLFGARGTQNRILQKSAVISKIRRGRPVTGVGRTLRMFHFLNRFIVCAQTEPGEHLAQTLLQPANNVLPAHPQLLPRGHAFEELADVPLQ